MAPEEYRIGFIASSLLLTSSARKIAAQQNGDFRISSKGLEHAVPVGKDMEASCMPYKGVDSLWAYASMIAERYFVIVVPKSVVMTLPEEVGQMFSEYSKNQTAITGIAVALAIFFVGIVAFFTSRLSTGHILNIIDAWKRLAKGDFSVRLKAHMKDERAQLVHAFNEIVPKIDELMRMKSALGLA